MDAPETPKTPEPVNAPRTPHDAASAISMPRATGAARRWGRTVVIAGVSALALVGAATLGAVTVRGLNMEAAHEDRTFNRMGGTSASSGAPMARGRDTDHVRVMSTRETDGRAHFGERAGAGRMSPDAREELWSARLSAVATELGLESDALIDAMDALGDEFVAEGAARREELSDATAQERREAMVSLAEGRRTRVRDLLIGLGADAAAVDALLEERTADGVGQRGPMSRRGPHAGGPGEY